MKKSIIVIMATRSHRMWLCNLTERALVNFNGKGGEYHE